MPASVHQRVTDGVTQASCAVVGLGPAIASVNGYLGHAQAQSVLAANMVQQQQQLALLAISATARNVARLLGRRARGAASGGGAAPVLKTAAPPPAPQSRGPVLPSVY